MTHDDSRELDLAYAPPHSSQRDCCSRRLFAAYQAYALRGGAVDGAAT